MTTKVNIRDFYGRILGSIETDEKGNKTARDFPGRIVGFYYASRNVTTDFYGRVVAQGDMVSSLIPPLDRR